MVGVEESALHTRVVSVGERAVSIVSCAIGE